MKRIAITIVGVTPLICNKFTDAAAMAATSGNKSSLIGGSRGTPAEQAKSKLYLSQSGEPAVPQPNLMRCLVEGGRFHKVGKKQVTTKTESLLYACMDVVGTEALITHKEPWHPDTRPVRIPSTGGRINTTRPMFNDWRIDFELDVDSDFISLPLVRQIVDDAGRRVGLGDFRPACKGPFGKFVVNLWEEEGSAKKRKAVA